MNEHSRSILHRIELRRRNERDKFGFAIQYEQPCSICVYSGSLAQASGLRSGQILAKVNGYNVLDARHDDVKRLVYAKHTNLLVLEVLDPDDDIDEEDSIECKENILSPSTCRITSKISVNDALRGRILRDINTGSSSTTNKYPIKHYYKKARESLTSSSQDSTTSTTSDTILNHQHHHHHHHHQKSFPSINRQRLSKVLISTNLRMLLSQINDIILLKDMYSSLTPGVNLIDSQSSLSFNHQTLYTFSSIDYLGYFDIDHNNNNQNELVKKIQKFLKRSILNPASNKIEFHIQCKQFHISPLWFKFLAGKYLSYICLFHTQPTLFALILYCSIKIDENIKKFQYEHNSSSMFVFRASSIDERNRIIQCLFTRAKHCSNHQCTMEDKRKKNTLDEPDTCSTNSSCATSIDSNIDSCTTGTTSQSSVESSSPNPLRSSIEEDDQHQRSIPPPPEFSHDDDSCPVPCSSSSSSSLSDVELLDNELGEDSTSKAVTTATTTGQFLWIDHHPRRHSFANDSHLIDGNNFHYHPSSPFLEHPSLIEDLRARFASAYILTTASTLTEAYNEHELSSQHETSINEGSIDLNDENCLATSWALSFEKLLNDEIGLYIFTEFLKKEFSQENIQFWIECEKLKKLSDPDEIRQKASSIWSTYLQDTDDGSCRINIDNRTRHECQQLLLTNPSIHTFEKAQSQIYQLMKYDSYTRFLKSDMYRHCIRDEIQGKSISYSKQHLSKHNEERSNSFVKLKDEEKKDKKRSPFLPWAKAFSKWKRPINPNSIPSSTSSNFDSCSIKSCQISSFHTLSR
ncbi:unnamed protein product [Rotaria socialis]|uniref:Uncharacterized protein n=1 Tax=Rotaria socialis TaxID=392032 RepID=A0A818J7R7_9BILA|nr:unnamed protein product [Rotaria socialis]CAF3534850.1 unnamed protein product [Rotaria socialis]CAF3636246.1 unnamed protein product [Rotaria socialis]CAF3740771.1 unnamed protein product [Rotaria socialis]CAF4147180.1 unnamed protein product [Rotaria socialis]